ncbi:MAG: MFS transporter [Acidimicrobiia bacterium]
MTSEQVRALALISVAQLLVLSLWFSASAVSQSLETAWGLNRSQVPWLTMAVQVGFVVGALASAVANLADRIPARRLFAISATIGAVANCALVIVSTPSFVVVLVARFITGAALAGVYPSGMKTIAGWFSKRRGMALGVLVGALTVGSALPHLVRGVGLDWQVVLTASSVFALLGVAIMLTVGDGPYETPVSQFSWRHLHTIASNRGFRLATVGYLGHMWELYAAWTWVATWVAASAFVGSSSVAAFVMIAIGGAGSWIAGWIADRNGRTPVAGGSLLISGTMAAATAVVFGGPSWLIMVMLVVWGATIVSDSAQFSAMVTEVVHDDVRGTALTLQTALGFSLTLVSIWLVSAVAEATSWQWAFLVLVPGPVVGIVAMVRLRRAPAAAQLAGGKG